LAGTSKIKRIFSATLLEGSPLSLPRCQGLCWWRPASHFWGKLMRDTSAADPAPGVREPTAPGRDGSFFGAPRVRPPAPPVLAAATELAR